MSGDLCTSKTAYKQLDTWSLKFSSLLHVCTLGCTTCGCMHSCATSFTCITWLIQGRQVIFFTLLRHTVLLYMWLYIYTETLSTVNLAIPAVGWFLGQLFSRLVWRLTWKKKVLAYILLRCVGFLPTCVVLCKTFIWLLLYVNTHALYSCNYKEGALYITV